LAHLLKCGRILEALVVLVVLATKIVMIGSSAGSIKSPLLPTVLAMAQGILLTCLATWSSTTEGAVLVAKVEMVVMALILTGRGTLKHR
jgi:hypothetical protein